MDIPQKLFRLNNISTGQAHWNGGLIVPILAALNEFEPITVYWREITFVSDFDRARYCQDTNEDPSTYGLISEFYSGLNRSYGSVFLCSNRQARGNCYSYSYNAASSSRAKQIVAEKNKNNMLDWHSTVIFFHHGILYYFDCNFYPLLHVSPYQPRTLRCLDMRSKLINCIEVMENHGIKINKIFATGLGGFEGVLVGSCRNLALEFVKELIASRITGTKLTKYTWVELKKGPREPSADSLEILEEI